MRERIDSSELIDRIERAFANVRRPQDCELTPGPGLDEAYVHKNWARVFGDDVARFEEFTSYLQEDMVYMRPAALHYFLPHVLVYFVRTPERVDFGGFYGLASQLHETIVKKSAGYRWPDISAEQSSIIAVWCSYIIDHAAEFCIDDSDDPYLERLLEVYYALTPTE